MNTKTFKTLLAGLLLLASIGSASAQTVIRIVGSNGDRTATQNGIGHILNAGWTFRGTSGQWHAADLSTVAGDNFGAWNGTYGVNNTPVIIKVSFSGALAGIAAVAGGQSTFRFVVTNGADGTDGNSAAGKVANPLTSSNPNDYETNKADFGFSTNFQSTSPYNGLFQGVTYSQVTEEIVGISSLGFYASPGFPGSPSSSNPTFVPNITTQLARQLYQQGALSLAHFTGDWTNDKNKIVYALGRNTDAGQRYGAYTEIGLGTSGQVRVWFPAVTGTKTLGSIVYSGTVTSHQLWPVNQQPGGIPVPLGSGGFSSGALLAQSLTVTLGPSAYKGEYLDENNQTQQLYPNATAGYYIGYVTASDASSRILAAALNETSTGGSDNRGVALTFNGVAHTAANVRNGSYTAWVYNRILKPQSGLSGIVLTIADALRDQIKTVDAAQGGGILNSDPLDVPTPPNPVFVKRLQDGGDVVPR